MAEVTIIYGTTGGNTQLVCEWVSSVLGKAGHKVQLQRAEQASLADVERASTLILACPTYGHGQLEPHFRPFFESIQSADLSGKKCAVIALGDPRYEIDYHLESAKVLEPFIQRAGGELITRPLLVSKSPVAQLQKMITFWAEDVAKKLT